MKASLAPYRLSIPDVTQVINSITHSQLRDALQVSETQLLLIDVVVDVDGLPPLIATQLLDRLPGHAVAAQVGGEPMPQAMRREVILQSLGGGIVQTEALGLMP